MTVFSSPRRTTSFRYVRVMWPDMSEVGEFPGVASCSVEENLESTLKASGSLSIRGGYSGPLDDMVRVYSHSEAPGEPDADVCHGTFFVSFPTAEWSGGGESVEADLYSVLKVLQDARATDAVSMPAGTDTVSFAASVAEGAGLKVLRDESAHKVSSDHAWDVGTDLLSIVNECLGWAGFSSAGVDGYGNVEMRRYTDPSGTEPSATLSDTEKGGPICGASVSRDHDPTSVPNVSVVVYSPGGEEDAPEVAVVRNDDPASPFSTVSRSREVTAYEEVQELSGTAADRALSNLRRAMRALDKYELDMLWWPCLVGDLVRVDYSRFGIAVDCTLVKRSVAMTPALRCTCTLRQTVDYFEATEAV